MAIQTISEFVSADGRSRVEIFRREDGSYGFGESLRSSDLAALAWGPLHAFSSRFDSRETAIAEAQSRVAWLQREIAWPARDEEARVVETCAPNWLQCPFCGKRFSMRDEDRWAGGRHLTCGQRIIVACSQ